MASELNLVNIMDIPFVNCTKEQFLKSKVKQRLQSDEKSFIVTANPEIVMETRSNPAYKVAVLSADFIVPDGTGILFAAKYKREPLTERIAGFDLMIDMLEMANEEGASCYFLGASSEINKDAVDNIKKRYPNINVAGRHHGYFRDGDLTVLELIRNSGADFVFVALGFPRQEIWIKNNIKKCEKGIFMGVGGSLDVMAGRVKRAPDFWIKLNLEWLYRVLRQPFRLKRLFPILKFMILVILGRT